MLPGFVIGKAKVGCDGSRLVRHDEVALFGRPTSVKQTSTISPSRKGRKENEKENKGHVIQQPQTFGHHRRDGTADSLKGEMDTHRQKNKKRGKEAGTRTIEELLQSGRSPKQFRINPLSTLTTPPAHPFLFPNHSIRMHQIYPSNYLLLLLSLPAFPQLFLGCSNPGLPPSFIIIDSKDGVFLPSFARIVVAFALPPRVNNNNHLSLPAFYQTEEWEIGLRLDEGWRDVGQKENVIVRLTA